MCVVDVCVSSVERCAQVENLLATFSNALLLPNLLTLTTITTHYITEDHYFRLEMHHEIFYGMGLVLSEIWDKQAKGLPILPLENTGKWELIYADGWRFESPGEGYTRSTDKKSCGLPSSSSSGGDGQE